MKILITGAGGPAGQALIRQLGARNHWLVGVDMNWVSDGLLADFIPIAAADDPRMIYELRDIIDEFRIELLIPTVAEELSTVAMATETGFLRCRVVIGPSEGVHIAHDKYLTMRRLDAAGVPIPDYALPSDFRSSEEAFERFGSPILIKPRVGRGSRGVRVIHREEDFRWSILSDKMIVQEFAPGDEFAPMVHVSVRDGRSQVGLVTKIKTPGCGSSGGYVKEVPAGYSVDVATVAINAVLALGLNGPVDLDLRRNRDGVPVVLEVNARFGANSEYSPGLVDAVLDDHFPLAGVPITPGTPHPEKELLPMTDTPPLPLDSQGLPDGAPAT